MLMSSTQPLAALENATEFVARHIGIAPEDEARMLGAIGAASRDALIDAIVPPSIRRHQPMALPPAATEAQALAELKALAGRNQLLKSFIGQGCRDPALGTVVGQSRQRQQCHRRGGLSARIPTAVSRALSA